MTDLLSRVDADPSGRLRAVAVLVICALVSLVLWYPLGAPSDFLRGLVARPTAICRFDNIFAATIAAGTWRMYFCSAGVAILTMAGPIVILVFAFIYRKALSRVVKGVAARLPKSVSFVTAPLAATILFAMAWSGSHYSTAWTIGFLPQTLFPGVIGLFTFAVARWSADAQRRLAPFFDNRDRLPVKARLAVAALVPMAISLVIMSEPRVSFTAVREQAVVLIGLASGFLMMSPRSGDVMAGVGKELADAARDANAAARQGLAKARTTRG